MKSLSWVIMAWSLATQIVVGSEVTRAPYAQQVAEQIAKLKSDSARTRATAAEVLGMQRAYQARDALIARLHDPSVQVRRQAALALAWCGDRDAVIPLIDALDDEDWVTRQSAHVSLTNLTGMELPFNGMATSLEREARAHAWRTWWAGVSEDRPPSEVLAWLSEERPWARTWSVIASSAYKGPPEVLIDGQVGPAFWQTKDVPVPQWCTVDLGLYLLDPTTKRMELIYNDPSTADFEPRPVVARQRPPVIPSTTRTDEYSGRFVCSSVFTTMEDEVRRRGRLVRLIEGVPVVARHSTHTNDWEVWKNHGGTLARVLGTAPLAPDRSFHVQAPADRLLHFQVLDSDRRVVGNQLTWIYTRPGEVKSCVGCHENPHHTARGVAALAAEHPPLDFLPHGDEFRYRAKAWFKGHLPPDIERRTRTVRAVNLLGR